ncbi:hypothetical protein BDW72DRAFT_182591 [Aspergillus terricola var. indicus]
MADPLSITASVAALIKLVTSVTTSVARYAKAVRGSGDDVAALQSEVVQFARTLDKLDEFLKAPDAAQLTTSKILADDIAECRALLSALESKLQPGSRSKVMSKMGIRGLKWPLERDDVEKALRDLVRYRASLALALQVDQMTFLTKISHTNERISERLDLDKLPAVSAAEFDAYIHQHENECFAGTRTKILDTISEWATSADGKCIFWLNGTAGTGKSTISRTVARAFQSKSILGASFFFKRGEDDRCNAMKFITTIARQLATNVPELAPKIGIVLANDSLISAKSMKVQFENLLLQPLSALKKRHGNISTIVLVVDALDECEPAQDIRLLLELLPRLRHITPVHVRVFLTSRPELPVRMGLSGNPDAHQDLVLHEVPVSEIRDDIALFFTMRLQRIRKDRGLPADWPGESSLDRLINMSVPLFVFAATVCRILEDRQWDPDDSLAEVLSLEDEESKLGATYLPVLNKLLAQQADARKTRLVKEFQDIVGPFLLLGFPMSVVSLSELISQPQKLIRLRLNSLHSVLDVPVSDSEPIRPFHISFREFLLDRSTRETTPFWVDAKDVHSKLYKHCMRILRQRLRKNILDLSGYGSTPFWHRRKDVVRVEREIPPELLYACLFWAGHLIKSSPSRNDILDAVDFLEQHFLHWLEAICSVDRTGYVKLILGDLDPLFQDYPDAARFLEDGLRFFSSFSELAHNVPLQLYSSALVFTPSTSLIRKKFAGERPMEIRSLPLVPALWNVRGECGTREDPFARRAVDRIMEFSPSGEILAVACSDYTIKVWQVSTGGPQQTLTGHSDKITTFAFSPPGRTLLASGSDDQSVRLWDTSAGLALSVLDQGCPVEILKFAPDGQLLACVREDRVVRLYNPTTGALERSLEDHSCSIWSMEFSPNGQLLAAGTDLPDGTVKIWCVSSGTLRHTLDCRSTTCSLSFSPDSAHLITSAFARSCCRRGCLRLWELTTGKERNTFVLPDTARNVKFSPRRDYLITDQGNVKIPGVDGEPNLWAFFEPELKNTVLKDGPWIVVNGEPIMCFLMEHEPSCWTIKDDLVALGFESGVTLIIAFNRGDENS